MSAGEKIFAVLYILPWGSKIRCPKSPRPCVCVCVCVCVRVRVRVRVRVQDLCHFKFGMVFVTCACMQDLCHFKFGMVFATRVRVRVFILASNLNVHYTYKNYTFMLLCGFCPVLCRYSKIIQK